MDVQDKARNTGFDNLSGLFILFMVLFYHLPQFCDLGEAKVFVILRNLFDCFMAWFFFKSGMFFNKERSVRSAVEKGFAHLVIPFLIFNVIFFIVGGWFENVSFAERFKVSLFQESAVWCAALWFLLSLFVVRVSYSFLVGKLRVNEWAVCALSLLLAFTMHAYSYHPVVNGFVSSLIPATIPSWPGNVFLGMFFFSMGSLLRGKQFDNKPLLYLAVAVYVAHLFFPSYLDFRTNESQHYLISVIYYLAGVIVFNVLFSVFFNNNMRLLTYVGRNSMIYYVMHFPFLKMLFVIFENHGLSGWVSFAIAFPITIVFLLISDLLFKVRKLRWIIGG